MKLRLPDNDRAVDLTSWQAQSELVLSEKTAKLEGAIVSERILEHSLMRLERISFTENLTRNYWFASIKRSRKTRPVAFLLRPNGVPTETDRAILQCLTDGGFRSAIVRHDGRTALQAREYLSSGAVESWYTLDQVLKEFGGKTEGKARAFSPRKGTVKEKRALTVLSLSRFAGNAERLLLERCFANHWLSRSFDYVFDVDFFSRSKRGLCAIEVKQKDPITNRAPLEVGINYGEAKLLSEIASAGVEVYLFYLIKPHVARRENKSKPLELLYNTSLIGRSCWLAARFPLELQATQQTSTAGSHTSLTGRKKVSYYTLKLNEHFCRLSPDVGCSGGLEIAPERLNSFLSGTLEKVSDKEILDRWQKDC